MSVMNMLAGTEIGETESLKYLVQVGILRKCLVCPSCGSPEILTRTVYRCRDCGHTWGMRGSSILAGTKISPRRFIDIVQCFCDDLPVARTAQYFRLSPGTVQILNDRIRTALIDGLDTGTLGDTLPENPGDPKGVRKTNDHAGPSGNKPVVLGIRLNNGKITAQRLPLAGNDLVNALQVPTSIRGNILLIDSYGIKYPGYIIYFPDRRGQETIRIKPKTTESWSHLAGFWHFLERSWHHHRDLDRTDIPAFVWEVTFRYNHRNSNLFSAVMKKIAAQDPLS